MAEITSNKVPSPFSKSQRNLLLSWSKRSKEENLLPPFERKVLYEGGHYNYIFVSRLHRLTKTLDMLLEHKGDDANEAEQIIDIKNVGYCCYLDAQSNAGDPEAQYCLADALYYGLLGLEEDEKKALYWMTEAAEQGHQEAMCEIARWHSCGFCGLEEDHPRAVEILETAIEHGSAPAKAMLGGWYNLGFAVEQDHERAFELFSQASSDGFEDGTFRLSLCYSYGMGVDRDPDKAFELMGALAETGYVPGMRVLGKYHFDGVGTDEDHQEALIWWHKAAENYDDFSIYRIGECHYLGMGVEEDDEQAFAYFKRASELGNSEADLYLGQMHYVGCGCEESSEKAFSYFSKAAEGGIEASNYYLGLCYYWGNGVERDYFEAYEYFELAKEINSDALFYLGECARNGMGCKRSFENAFEFYIQTADADNPRGQMAIGRAFYLGEGVEANDVEAIKWLELAADAEASYVEASYAQYLLGECYLKGFGVVENKAKGIALLRKAAKAGETKALQMLHEFGYDLEDSPNPVISEEGKNVVGIHLDPLSRAKALYSKTIEKLRESDQEKSSDNVVQLSIKGSERIEALMASNQEGD